jgi:hypothetical protein
MHPGKIQAHTVNFRQRDFEQGDRPIRQSKPSSVAGATTKKSLGIFSLVAHIDAFPKNRGVA